MSTVTYSSRHSDTSNLHIGVDLQQYGSQGWQEDVLLKQWHTTQNEQYAVSSQLFRPSDTVNLQSDGYSAVITHDSMLIYALIVLNIVSESHVTSHTLGIVTIKMTTIFFLVGIECDRMYFLNCLNFTGWSKDCYYG